MREESLAWKIEKVSKLDAARRQLRTALRLFFQEADPVSIHTLASASHEILRTLVKSKGGASLTKDTDFIRPEFQREFERRLNRPQNFFKHAKSDPNDVLDFAPEGTAFDLYDCVMMDFKLNGNRFSLRECVVFVTWFMLTYPHLLKAGAVEQFPEVIRHVIAQKQAIERKRFLNIVDRPDEFPMPEIK